MESGCRQKLHAVGLSAQAGDELVEPPGDLQVALGRLRGVPFGERPTDRAHRHQDGGKGRRDE